VKGRPEFPPPLKGVSAAKNLDAVAFTRRPVFSFVQLFLSPYPICVFALFGVTPV